MHSPVVCVAVSEIDFKYKPIIGSVDLREEKYFFHRIPLEPLSIYPEPLTIHSRLPLSCLDTIPPLHS